MEGELLNLVAVLNKEKLSLQHLLKALKSTKKLIEDPVNNLDKIKASLTKMEQLSSKIHFDSDIKNEVLKFVEALKKEIPSWEEKRKNAFGFSLEEVLTELQLPLDGHYPLLKTYLFTIEISFESGKIILWYGPQQEKLATTRISIPEIYKKIKENYLLLTERKINEDKFLEGLYSAYKIQLSKTGKELGAHIPITYILSEYAFLIQDKRFKTDPKKEYYREYGRVFFSYDLFLLKKRVIDNMEFSLVGATRSYTRKKSDFLWIPTDQRGGGFYVSHIVFREVKR